MKKLGLGLGFVFLVLVVLAWFGPRVQVDLNVKTPVIGKDVEAHIQAEEAKFSDIRPHCEKNIVWASPEKKKTKVAFVYLHGFSASRMETEPYPSKLAAHFRANLFSTRLRGHGRTGKAFAEATVNDWLYDTKEALEIGRRLGEKVVLVATSTGATLSMWLALQKEGKDIAGMVFISPNFTPKNSMTRVLLWPWGETIVQLLLGKERKWKPTNELQAKYWTHQYPSKILVQMMGAVQLLDKADFSKIKQPVIMFYSPKDTVISGEKVRSNFPKFGAKHKQLVAIPGVDGKPNHVLVGDVITPEGTEPVLQKTVAFLKPVIGEPPGTVPTRVVAPAPSKQETKGTKEQGKKGTQEPTKTIPPKR